MESLTMRKDECSEMGLGLSGNSSRLTFEPSLSVWLVWLVPVAKVNLMPQNPGQCLETWKELGHENVKAWANQSGPAKDKDLKSQAVIAIIPVIFTYLYSSYHLIHGPTPVTPIRLFAGQGLCRSPMRKASKGLIKAQFPDLGYPWYPIGMGYSGIYATNSNREFCRRGYNSWCKKQDRAFLY